MAILPNPPAANPRCRMPLQSYAEFFAQRELNKWHLLETADMPGDDAVNRRALLINAARRSGFIVRSTLQDGQIYFMVLGKKETNG